MNSRNYEKAYFLSRLERKLFISGKRESYDFLKDLPLKGLLKIKNSESLTIFWKLEHIHIFQNSALRSASFKITSTSSQSFCLVLNSIRPQTVWVRLCRILPPRSMPEGIFIIFSFRCNREDLLQRMPSMEKKIFHFHLSLKCSTHSVSFIQKFDDSGLTACELNVSESGVAAAFSEHKKDDPDKDISKDLGELLKSGKFSDITLRVEEAEFKAHRLILALRSPVFDAMWKYQTLEQVKNVVVIEDCRSEIFSYLLQYIYSSEIGHIDLSTALSLYEAADKYDVQHLKAKCEDVIIRNINKSNALQILVLADMHNEKRMRQAAEDYFAHNIYDLLHTEEWLTLMKNHTVLASALLLNYVCGDMEDFCSETETVNDNE